jgi:hypothetical protein
VKDQTKVIESNLRNWLREVLGDRVAWIEAARGGTVGLPDCLIKTKTMANLPVELKVIHEQKSGLKFTIRPAQVRYHALSARDGRRTAFLGIVGERDRFVVSAVPGHRMPLQYPGVGFLAYERQCTKCSFKRTSACHVKGCGIAPLTHRVGEGPDPTMGTALRYSPKKRILDILDSPEFWA